MQTPSPGGTQNARNDSLSGRPPSVLVATIWITGPVSGTMACCVSQCASRLATVSSAFLYFTHKTSVSPATPVSKRCSRQKSEDGLVYEGALPSVLSGLPRLPAQAAQGSGA